MEVGGEQGDTVSEPRAQGAGSFLWLLPTLAVASTKPNQTKAATPDALIQLRWQWLMPAFGGLLRDPIGSTLYWEIESRCPEVLAGYWRFTKGLLVD